jgi:hypothetical protein
LESPGALVERFVFREIALGFGEIYLANATVGTRKADGGVGTKRRFSAAHARREESVLASRRIGCAYGDVGVLVDGIHLADFEALVEIGILNNAERVYPEELEPEFSGRRYGVSERGWEMGYLESRVQC